MKFFFLILIITISSCMVVRANKLNPLFLQGNKGNSNLIVNNDTIKKHRSDVYWFFKFHDEPVLNLNIQQGWRTMGEIAFSLADYEGKRNRFSLNVLDAIGFGSQFNFNPKHFIIGPELVYNVSFLFFNFGGCIVYLTDFKKGTVYLNPHLGVSYNTFFDLYAGYNIPLMTNHMKTLVNNFTVTLAVPLIKRNFKL
jgi:hypothetical protein